MRAAIHTLAKQGHAFSLTTLSLLVLTTITAGFGVQPASAQPTTADTLQQTPQSGEYSSDPFSGTGNGQMNSVFDLIHRASQGGIRSMSEVQQEQRENISSEAVEFRNRQMELLRQQNQPESSNTTPSTPQQN
ncbi:MAG: hypothetical protein SFY66_07770 [Oculatellaceae cyanobacterium bins.114]|nr:hypothetical protein [Oculatellaceae cyanobacterium bins.114]